MTSSLNLYDFVVPFVVKRLQQLRSYVKKGEDWANGDETVLNELLDARIYEDMHPLPFQVQTPLRMTIFLLGQLKLREMPAKMPEPGKSFPEMYQQIDQALEMLESVKREDFHSKAEMEVHFAPGPRPPWHFTGLTFVQEFILPNYLFHAVTAYNILRLKGVPLGKMDYIGKVGS